MIINLAYLLIGGMGIGTVYDSVYASGLLIGGISIPIIGLYVLGDGSSISGFTQVVNTAPEK